MKAFRPGAEPSPRPGEVRRRPPRAVRRPDRARRRDRPGPDRPGRPRARPARRPARLRQEPAARLRSWPGWAASKFSHPAHQVHQPGGGVRARSASPASRRTATAGSPPASCPRPTSPSSTRSSRRLGHPQHPAQDPQRARPTRSATAPPSRCRSSSASRRATSGRAPRPARSWPPCSTASCCRKAVRPILTAAGPAAAALGPRPHAEAQPPRVTPAEVDAGPRRRPWRCRGRTRRRRRWRRSCGSWPRRASSRATAGSSRRSAWPRRSPTCAAPTRSSRSTWRCWRTSCGTTRRSSPQKVAQVIARVANPTGMRRQPAPAGVRAGPGRDRRPQPGPGGHGRRQAGRDRPAARAR